MAVGGEPPVDGLSEAQVSDDGGGPEVKDFVHGLGEHVVGHGAGAEGGDVHAHGVRHADGIGQLHLAAVREACGHDVFRNPASGVGCAAVHLRRVLAGEGAAAVRGAAAVGVHDDLAAREAGVRSGAALHEAAGRVDVVLDISTVQLRGDGGQDDVLDHVGADLLEGDVRAVLSGDDDGIHADGLVFAVVLDGYLGLAVGTEVGQQAALAHLGEAAGHFLRQGDGQGHEFRGLVAGVAEHHALVAGAVFEAVALLAFLELEGLVNAHGDVAGLLVDGGDDGAGVAVKAVGGVVVADLAHDLARDLRDVHIAAGGDLAHDVDHARGGGALTGDVALRVLLEYRVQHRVGDLVADLVGMALGDGFGREEVVCHLNISFLI